MKRLTFVLCFAFTQLVMAESIVVAYDSNIPPYSYTGESGEATGAVIDVWRLWARDSHNEISFVPCSENACIELLRKNKVDAIAGIFGDMDDSSLIFGRTVSRTVTAVYVRSDQKVRNILELEQPLVVLDDPRLLRVIDIKLPDYKLTMVENSEQLAKLIESRKVSAFVAERPDPIHDDLENPPPAGYRRLLHLSTSEIKPVLSKNNLPLFRSMMKGTDNIDLDKVLLISDKYHLGIRKKSSNAALYFVLVLVIIFLLIISLYLGRRLKQRDLQTLAEPKDWHAIISRGESQKIEFKSSFHWDYRKQETNKGLEKIILKTITAFLNSDGGMLFIGVDDDGVVLGLEKDYSTFSKKNSDGLVLAVTNLINQNLGKYTHSFINIDVVAINDKDVCIVNVSASDKPVFIKEGASEAFYIRASASSQPLSMSEAFEYIKGRWSHK